MARLAHPQAMQPKKAGRTRTAPARMPDEFPLRGRYLSYIAFGATSFFFLCMGLLVMRVAFALGGGAAAWAELQQEFRNPVYVGFHVLALVVFVWAGWRFLIKLAPKANPPKIGPLRRPPLSVFPPLLGAAWLGATALFLILLWGIFP
jgi:fumarate reductase subunit C